MHDEHRRYLRCIFCERTDLTSEHIFGKALARRIPLKSNWSAHHTGPSGYAHPPVYGKGGSPILSITASLLCNICNTTTLSKEVNASIETLFRMTKGHRLQLDANTVRSLRRYFERIGLIVDVITSNHDIDDAAKEKSEYRRSAYFRQLPAIITDPERFAWIRKGHLAGVTVYIGHHRGVMGLNPYVNIAHGKVVNQATGQLLAWKWIVLVIGELAAFIRIGHVDHEPPASWLKLPSNNMVAEKFSAWPSRDDVSYDDILVLASQDWDVVQKRFYFNLKPARRIIEEHSRAVGEMSYPPNFHDEVMSLIKEEAAARGVSLPEAPLPSTS